MRIVLLFALFQYIYMQDDGFCTYRYIQKVVFWGLASHFDQETDLHQQYYSTPILPYPTPLSHAVLLVELHLLVFFHCIDSNNYSGCFTFRGIIHIRWIQLQYDPFLLCFVR